MVIFAYCRLNERNCLIYICLIFIFFHQPGPLFPSEIRMSTTGAKLCPQICPWNNALIAHTCSGDLYLSHSITGSSVRLTHARKGGRSLVDDPLTAGTPSYVMQEEFTRLSPFNTGYSYIKSAKIKKSLLPIVGISAIGGNRSPYLTESTG